MKTLTECEVVVMKTIWESDHPIALPEIIDSVNNKYGKSWKPQTVSTFLTRLVKKGFLNMKRQGRTFLYTPVVPVLDYGEREIRKSADLWGNNNVCIYLEEIKNRRGFTPEEIEGIRALIDNAN